MILFIHVLSFLCHTRYSREQSRRMKSVMFSALFMALNVCSWNLLLAKEMYVKYERGFLFKYKIFQYEDEDLATSVTLGRRCEGFIKKETQTFGVDGEDEADTKPHAINVCQQVAMVSNTHYAKHTHNLREHKYISIVLCRWSIQ